MMLKKRVLAEGLLFFVVAAALYLLFAKEFGYYNDDWYSMYAARVAGADIYHEIFGVDRPGRAYVTIPIYLLFKNEPFFYSLSAYVFRVAGALMFLWLLRLLWSERKTETFLVAFLFLIYPGFLDMPIAIDFQTHLLGIFVAYLSLALMVKGFSVDKIGGKASLWLASVLTGWIYLSQMEYYIGFEGVRLTLVVLLALREKDTFLKDKVKSALLRWLPYAIIPGGFLFWRLFIFETGRSVTDISFQLGKLFSDTLLTLYTWGVNLLKSFLNVLVLAWTEPLTKLAFQLDLRSSLRGILLALVLMILISIVFYFFKKHETVQSDADENHWMRESLILGLTWIVLGLLPVILVNRTVQLWGYSRYGFASAGGAMLVLIYFFSQLKQVFAQRIILAFFVFSASFTHYGNSVYFVNSFATIREFWWQVSWRVPQFEQRTTLIASYPGGVKEASFVWGPANQIYYPEGVEMEGKRVQTGLYALMLNDNTVMKVLMREKATLDRYNVVETYPNARNILILSKPTGGSCVQVIDGQAPVYSANEISNVMLIGEYSEADRILIDDDSHIPPSFLFDTEPEHDWCYFYEKAALARQRGDWAEVAALDAEANDKGFVPRDIIEWMPFIQASAMLEDGARVKEISSIIHDEFIRQQACEVLLRMELTLEMRTLAEDSYCMPQ